MSFSAIIFDHDGTLVDSEGIHYNIWRELLSTDFGIKFSKQEYLNHHCGVPTLQNAETIVQQYALDLNAQQLYQRNTQAMHAWLSENSFPLFATAKPALDQCRNAGLKIGLATGASNTEANATLKGHELAEYFTAVTTKDDVEHTKPAPETYLLTAHKLGVEPQACIAIEDSSTGIASAKAAGMVCIAVSNDYSVSQDVSLADHQVDDLQQAVNLVLTQYCNIQANL